MAGGYFDDGEVCVELGAHVFATPAAVRSNLLMARADAPAPVHPQGGGVMSLIVTGQRLRQNLGDAERYVFETFRALVLSGPGALGIEDEMGRRSTFAGAVCTAAQGAVRAFRFVEMRLEFLCPQGAHSPAWFAPPAPPEVYPGTGTDQDYFAGGVQIGVGEGMELEMARSYPVRTIPRARGGRARGPARGAHVRFAVRGHCLAEAHALPQELAALARDIGPGRVDLSANGNTYPDVVLGRVRPRHGDGPHASFEAEFIQEITTG